MVRIRTNTRWKITTLACIITTATALHSHAQQAPGSQGKELNPFHEKQIQQRIQACAAEVLNCRDGSKEKVLKQQELCQLLIRSDRYDQALEVAHNIFKTPAAGDERQAAHHYLMAEIYRHKMNSSHTSRDMEQNRQYALTVAQEVLDKKYPANWEVSRHARTLIKELTDSRLMGVVQQRVAEREGTNSRNNKEEIANAQRRYLDATQGRSSSTRQPGPSFTRRALTAVDPQPQFASTPVANGDKRLMPISAAASAPSSGLAADTATGRLPASPTVSKSLVKDTNAPAGGDIAIRTGNSSRPGATSLSAEEIAQNNLKQLLEAAKKRREAERKSSPYASGQAPGGN